MRRERVEDSGGLDVIDSGTAPRRKAGSEGAQGRRGELEKTRQVVHSFVTKKKRREMGWKLRGK